MPHLCLVPSALRKIDPPNYTRRIRALDVGAVRINSTSACFFSLRAFLILVGHWSGYFKRSASSSRGRRASRAYTFLHRRGRTLVFGLARNSGRLEKRHVLERDITRF